MRKLFKFETRDSIFADYDVPSIKRYYTWIDVGLITSITEPKHDEYHRSISFTIKQQFASDIKIVQYTSSQRDDHKATELFVKKQWDVLFEEWQNTPSPDFSIIETRK